MQKVAETPALIFFIGLITLLFLSGCKVDQYLAQPVRTLDETTIVERDKGGAYELSFEDQRQWTVYQGTGDAYNIDWSTPLVIGEDELFTYEPTSDERLFFGLVSNKGDVKIVSERQIPLRGAKNFRDLGGIMTKDGRIVEWGKIYRSNKLSKLKKEDLEYLNALDIGTVCDLRYDIEVKKHPDRLPEDVVYHQFPIGERSGDLYMKLRKQVIRKELKGQDAKGKFIELMGIFADSAAHYFKPVVDLLAEEENAPLVYHCAGGKDRTGFLSAVILLALGVDEETVREDYLMSNYYRYESNRSGMKKARIIGLDYETLLYGFAVHDEYMDAVFEVIHEEYGGVDNYLKEQFGLDEEKRAMLRERYTTPIAAYLPQPMDEMVRTHFDPKP
jgi:protein-tyrosine phosphatase